MHAPCGAFASGRAFHARRIFPVISDFPASHPNEFPQAREVQTMRHFCAGIRPLFWAKTVSHCRDFSAFWVRSDARMRHVAHRALVNLFWKSRVY
jgi:hypothetical protein